MVRLRCGAESIYPPLFHHLVPSVRRNPALLPAPCGPWATMTTATLTAVLTPAPLKGKGVLSMGALFDGRALPAQTLDDDLRTPPIT